MEKLKNGKDAAADGRKVSYFSAECMEFIRYGEYRENIKTAEEAVKVCEEIPSERLNAGKEVIKLVRDELEWYTPKAIRRVEIDKGNGKKRPLGIASIEDRLIQQCILQVLEPICEAKFHDRSNGFRLNRGVENAHAQAEKLIQSRRRMRPVCTCRRID